MADKESFLKRFLGEMGGQIFFGFDKTIKIVEQIENIVPRIEVEMFSKFNHDPAANAEEERRSRP